MRPLSKNLMLLRRNGLVGAYQPCYAHIARTGRTSAAHPGDDGSCEREQVNDHQARMCALIRKIDEYLDALDA